MPARSFCASVRRARRLRSGICVAAADGMGERWDEERHASGRHRHAGPAAHGTRAAEVAPDAAGERRAGPARRAPDAATEPEHPRRERGSYAGLGPRGWRRPDTRLFEDACERLTDDPDVDATDVVVTVADGEITLDGTVPTRAMKRFAEDCVATVAGVVDVHNRLRVAATG